MTCTATPNSASPRTGVTRKAARLPPHLTRKSAFCASCWNRADDDADLLDQIRDDVFEDRVYAISPKGDVVELPAEATPLDFAYHVHTQVGHRCRGAKVNGRIVPLTYHVKNGDQIEIITGSQPQAQPRLAQPASSATWPAQGARAKVRNWFRQQDRDQHLRQGREILDRELARLTSRDVPTDAIAKQLKHKEHRSTLRSAGRGRPDCRLCSLRHCRTCKATMCRRRFARNAARRRKTDRTRQLDVAFQRRRRPAVAISHAAAGQCRRKPSSAISRRAAA